MYIYKGNLVGANIEYIWSRKNKTPIISFDSIIIHYTAGYDAHSAANYLANENTNVSAHVIVGRKGEIIQMVDFETQAWHAGKSRYRNKVNLNRFSIGIELENYGPLSYHNGQYLTWFNKIVPANEVIELKHPQTQNRCFWQTFTNEQLNTLEALCKLLLLTYKFRRIVGHDEISLSGKIDPGPAFPMQRYKTLIYSAI